MTNTLLLIKPNSIANHNIGEIISIIEKDGFEIQDIKIFTFTNELINNFYQEHIGKSFFERLVEFMTSGKTIAIRLSRENAVDRLRMLIGSAKPEEREAGTIRAIFADTISKNAVHGSDCSASVEREVSILFKS